MGQRLNPATRAASEQARQAAAKHNACTASVNFNGTHQALIYNIARTYYQYGAASRNLQTAKQTLADSRRLQDAADTRCKNGVDTTIESAQAKQIGAQADFRLVPAEDAARPLPPVTGAAIAAHEQVRTTATCEIVVASDTPRSARASHSTASELVNAAGVTYNASFEAFKNGLVPITDVTTAGTGLLDARQTQVDAHAPSPIAASTRAFSLGNMTSKNLPSQAVR